MELERIKSLNDILGQDRAVSVLKASMASGRIHHAWIFSGPQGVGKRTVAEAFAAAILDPTTAPNLSGEIESDPDSHTQRLIAAGNHPDLHIITKELAKFDDDKKIRERKLISIPKEVVERYLLEPIALSSTLRTASLASKVFIVDEAELLDRSMSNAVVQNSILKTLEEPPPGSVIILVTSAEERLLPTIRSRCQRVVFAPLSAEAMDQWIKRSRLEVSKDDRKWLEQFAAGSPGKALQAVEGGMIGWWRTIEPMLADIDRGRFAPALGTTMAKLIEDWARQWVSDHPNASKEAANIAGTRHMLSLIAERARQRLRAGGSDVEREVRSIDLVEQADRYIGASVPIASAMENLSAQLAARSFFSLKG